MADQRGEKNHRYKDGAYMAFERHCDRCGTPYTARRLTSRYCSDACRIEGTRYGRTYGRTAPRQLGVYRPEGVR